MLKDRDHRELTEYVFRDRVFSASYTISSGMVHVTAIQGRKSDQRGDATAQSVADRLFREIIHEAESAGTLR
jgi:hypothetical protein